MANYNSGERLISGILSSSPKLKKCIKKIYQHFNYILYKKKYNFKSDCDLFELDYEGNESFFGYYDKSPVNNSNRFLVFHSTDNSSHLKPGNNPIHVILFDLKENKVIKKFITNAYNWQQGSKLQWIDTTGFIFNDFSAAEQKYVSRIYNVEESSEKIINFPIYDTFKDNALSLNFNRLNLLRPDYGYRNLEYTIDFSKNDNDGIYLINLQSNSSKLLISIEDVIKLHYKDSMKDAKHWFNHIMISPKGKRFMFLHRWLDKGRKHDALVVADFNGKNVSVLADDDMVSHCCWNGDNEIISYMRDIKYGDGYYFINVISRNRRKLDDRYINSLGDGHPSIHGNVMLLDTYPNKSRMKELFLFDLESNNLTKLGEFHESMKFYGETRCDLHPRFSNCGKYVFFDSVHSSRRKLYRITIDKDFK